MPVQLVRVQSALGSNKLTQGVLCHVGLFDRAVELGTVAGGNDRGLADATAGRCTQTLAQSPDRRTDLVSQKHHALTHGERRGGVIEPRVRSCIDECVGRYRAPGSLWGTTEL